MLKKKHAEILYSKLPYFLQNIAVSIQGKKIIHQRFNKDFKKRLEDSELRQYATEEDLLKYQHERLKTILHTAQKSPYWEEKFLDYNISISSDDLFSEIKKLPILTKDQVKENNFEIIPNTADNNRVSKVQTSGTTGSGLEFIQTQEAEHEQWAVWWRYRQWHGINQNTLCGQFGGKIIVPIQSKTPPYWRINKPGKQVIFSSYHINEDTAIDYVDAIKQYRIPWLHGYPSALALLAGFIIEQNLESMPDVKIITIGSEGLQPSQKELIEKAFGAKVYQHYGLAEAVANISQCKNGNLHVDEDFSYVEFIPTEYENTYKLIGTNFYNLAFPLIRYDTTDLVTIDNEVKCKCGNIGRIIREIDGRKDDYVLLPDGNKIGRLSHIFKANKYIKEAQIKQSDKHKITIHVVKIKGYDENNEENILLLEARKWLGEQINIDINYTEKIRRTRTGKLRLVVSELV